MRDLLHTLRGDAVEIALSLVCIGCFVAAAALWAGAAAGSL